MSDLGAQRLTGKVAFGDRTIGNLSRPHFPDGEVSRPHGPFGRSLGQFNPFSTGIERNAQTGQLNPQYAQALALNPKAANSLDVARYMEPYGYNFRDINRTLWVEGDYLIPAYAERPWVMWTANPTRQIKGVGAPAEWIVVKH